MSFFPILPFLLLMLCFHLEHILITAITKFHYAWSHACAFQRFENYKVCSFIQLCTPSVGQKLVAILYLCQT